MVDKVQGVQGVNPVTAQIPGYILQQMQAQRQQQLAQALTQQAISPVEYDPRGRISWTQGLAKMLQLGVGNSMANSSMQSQSGLQQQGMQAMGQALGMGQPSPSQYALTQGSQAGSVGPTNDNAARLADALSPAQKQGVSGAVMSTPYNTLGLPPMALLSEQSGDPAAKAQNDVLRKNLELTDASKNNMWQGIQPDQAKAITLSDAANKGFHGFDPGQPWTNTFTGQGGYAPKLPDNAQPNAPFTPGSPIPSVGVVPGSQGVMQGNANAGALGTTAGTVHTVTNPDGSTSMGTGGNLGLTVPPQVQAARDSDALTILRQERAKPGNSPADNAALDREIERAQVRPGVVTGPNASFKPMVDQGGKLLSDAQSAQTNNQSTYAYLDEMKQLAAGGAAFGPGTANLAHFKALANNYVPGIDLTGAQTNQDVMHKLASTLAGSQSPRSDADLANWQARYPSGELTNAAIAQLIPILQKQANVVDARANVMTRASSAGLDKLPDLANRFNQIASPSLVADGQALAQASKAGPQAVQAFVSQYRATHKDAGQRLQTIQQLDGMGAF